MPTSHFYKDILPGMLCYIFSATTVPNSFSPTQILRNVMLLFLLISFIFYFWLTLLVIVDFCEANNNYYVNYTNIIKKKITNIIWSQRRNLNKPIKSAKRKKNMKRNRTKNLVRAHKFRRMRMH